MISHFNGSKKHYMLIIHVFPSFIFNLNLNQRLIQELFCVVILNISKKQDHYDNGKDFL